MYYYAWFVLSVIMLAVWAAIYLSLKNKTARREIFVVSAWTSLLGLTEPLFVPAYWNPPSLFNLAERTGFDLESLLFAFAVGGIVVSAYEYIFAAKHLSISHSHRRHRFHLLALASPPITLLVFLIFLPVNVIYSASLALLIGFFFTCYCRPDLVRKMAVSGALFTVIYFLSFFTLRVLFPGYVEAVWNLSALSGWFVVGVPVEELLWAFTFGLYWSSVYEHLTWRKII